MRAVCRPCDVEGAAGTFEDPAPPCWYCGGETRLVPGGWPHGSTTQSIPVTLEDLLAL